MPRTMLNDEHWSKLSAIMLKDRVYDKPEHRNTMEGILIECEQAVLGGMCQSHLVIGEPFIDVLIYGQRKVF